MHRRRGTFETATSLRAQFHGSPFTTAQAERAGISPRRLGQATDAGFVVRIRRGLYCVADAGVPDAAETHLAVARHLVDGFRARGIRAAVGDECGAQVWQLPHGPLTVPTIVVPRGSSAHLGTRHGVRIRQGDVDDVVHFRGLAVTSPLATARDLSRHLPRYQAVALFGLAERRQAEWLLAEDERMDPGDLTDALADAQLRADLARAMGHLLAASAQRKLWCRSADPRPETYLEGISWGRFTGWSLGNMQPQAWVRGGSGRRYRVDVLIDGIAGEADGAVKYESRQTLWKEKLRQEDIEEGGTPVVRWTFAEAEHHPDVLLARWRRALRRHAA